MTRVAIYARISSDREETELGIERQIDSCQALADRLGFTVVATYADNNISAFTGKRRPQWEKLKTAIGDGSIDGIVCWGIDRLYRRPIELEHLMDLLERRRTLFIHPVNASKVDLNTTDGRNQARLAVVFANHESERKSERLVLQREQAAANGLWNGGRVPLGYKKHPTKRGHLLIHPGEARALRQIAKMVLADKSLYACYTYWLKVTGRTIAQNTLKNALLSPTITGFRVHLPQRDRVKEAIRDLYRDSSFLDKHTLHKATAWSPILQYDEWLRVRGKLQRPEEYERRAQGKLSRLAGVLYCGVCGVKLGFDGKSYRCSVTGTNGTPGGHVGIQAEKTCMLVEGLMLEWLQSTETELSPPVVSLVDRTGESNELQQRIQRNKDMYEAGEIAALDELRARNEPLRVRLRELAKAQAMHDAAHNLVSNKKMMLDQWDELDGDQQRAAMKTAMKVYIMPASKRGNVFDTDRLVPIYLNTGKKEPALSELPAIQAKQRALSAP
ncbi:recombinase family protein [Pseudarthrobacter niigatensis]|uniref:DNA invertase Pin-like site-specific DNA recombinase n=1 Tax=Pseudarthrobacter niigatensis TaxID=369935 RepID=A0AAJ1SV47_9MICC|nr:recombinase family protein [Pseudarthrobacter niigatensis]MDQ0144963.1 DNA invertase Pin-like site-specific DNA recombinase [Pseudarthrobacter niigatensis]MDQ0264400.1 DNA invertase Pin-like site-specific DNA recombinase [Pseudarthrobacter niigatensis]